MKLWLISQTENNDYETFDSAVVAAHDETIARHTHPRGGQFDTVTDKDWEQRSWGNGWASHPNNVTAKYIGEAAEGITSVVCTSFNAG